MSFFKVKVAAETVVIGGHNNTLGIVIPQPGKTVKGTAGNAVDHLVVLQRR